MALLVAAKGDYVPVSGQLVTIAAGDLSGYFDVEIGDDDYYESDEHFTVGIIETSLVRI